MLRKLSILTVGLLILLAPSVSFARARGQGWCEQGNQTVTITGAGTTTTFWQRSHPSCTVTVYATGTVNLSTIFSDDAGTPLANPFTAQSNGVWFFYADNGRYDVQLSGAGIATPFTLADIFLIDTASLSATNAAWNAITNPTGNQGLTMGTHTTVWTWGVLTGTTDAFTIVDGVSTGTGNLLEVRTASGSTVNPVRFTAQGTANGVQMDTAGLLSAVGSGGIAATTLACTTCISDAEIDATGISTRTKLPSAVAYEDEANSFTQTNTFQQNVNVRGGTAFNLTLTGTPTVNRTITISDADQTLVGRATTDTLSSKTFSDDIVWQSGTSFTGTLAHANTVNRVYTFPDATGTIFLLPTLTAGSVLFTDGTSVVEDNANLFWNNTSNRLGVGINSSLGATLHVAATAVASEVAARIQGNSTANTNVLEVYNSAASPALISRFDSTGMLVTTGTITLDSGDAADSGDLRLGNARSIAWEASPTGTDETLQLTASENFSFSGPLEVDAADPADAEAIRFDNNEGLAWEASPTGTDVTLKADASEIIQASTSVQAATSFISPVFTTNAADPGDSGLVRLANAENLVWEASPTGTDVTVGVDSAEILQVSTSVQATTSLISPVFVTNAADPADAGVLRLANAEIIAWEASPASTDVTLSVNASEQLVSSNDLVISTLTSGSVLFAGTSGLVSQNNANLFWDNSLLELVFGGDASISRSSANTLTTGANDSFRFGAGDLALLATSNIIHTTTTDASDNADIRIRGGGGAGNTRGGELIISGNEVAAVGGSLQFLAGNTATGELLFQTGAAAVRLRVTNAGIFRVEDATFELKDFGTFGDQDTTPSVGAGNLFKTANTLATTITAFDDDANGQQFCIVFGDANTTVTDGGTIFLQGAGNFVSTADDTMCLTSDGTNNYEISRSVN